MNTIKVLIVDDAALVRRVLKKILKSDPMLDVVGTAHDAQAAMQKIKTLQPDVITLDIVMPGMDGLTFLERLMKSHPLPVVMISTLTSDGAPETFKALELGAVEVIPKPEWDVSEKLEEMSIRLIDVVKAAAQAKIKSQQQLFLQVPAKKSADAVLTRSVPVGGMASKPIIAVGSSTGGTDALRELLQPLPADTPGIVIVQHMPALFTAPFAQRLDRICAMIVREAVDGDRLSQGTVLVAPGDQHLLIDRDHNGYVVRLDSGPLVNRHRPSVDVLFRSVAASAGAQAVGIILTGMGSDGAQGMQEMKQAGAHTIAQDEASCVVFGMPKMAIKAGCVDHILPLSDIATSVLQLVDADSKSGDV